MQFSDISVQAQNFVADVAVSQSEGKIQDHYHLCRVREQLIRFHNKLGQFNFKLLSLLLAGENNDTHRIPKYNQMCFGPSCVYQTAKLRI
jgi:hypothetical protein